MVAGHLQEKNGMFYVVLNYRDENGKRKTPWISTNLPVKGNKKRAENFMMDVRRMFSGSKNAKRCKKEIFSLRISF